MPTISVNLGAVKDEFEELPVGKYLGEIVVPKLREATERGKFDQLMIPVLVIEGDLTGKRGTIWLSFSPKAAFMMKRFFNKFGLGDTPALEFDDETLELMEPDISGYRVIFEVKPDRKDPDRLRTELVSVEDDSAPAPVATTVKPPKLTKAAPVVVEEVEEEVVDEPAEDPAAAKAAAKAARIAAAQAALEAAAADDDDDEEEAVEAEAPAPRKPVTRPAPAARTAPARRTLR